MEADDAALRAYYERGMERERLSDGRGDLEFTRTTEIVLRRLPAAPAVVADVGGGPGRYALWLASLGYQVEHRDLIPLHVEQLKADTAGVAEIDRTGMLPPLHEGAFTAFCHRPGELREEITEAGLEVTDLVSVEGPAFILGDLDARMADPVDRSIALEVARAIERVSELAGFGPHLIATGIS
jgi:SAM-dependent methyltransferase